MATKVAIYLQYATKCCKITIYEKAVKATKSQLITESKHTKAVSTVNATAYHSDNTCQILWSDLKLKKVLLLNVGLDVKERVLAFVLNQGKTNTSGHADEQAAFQHHHTELCAIGTLSFYFFSHFHILAKAPSDFAPVFGTENTGDLDVHSWMKVENNISINKVTHVGHPYAATAACKHQASRDDTKGLGRWSMGGSFQAYDHTLLVDVMMGAAGFNTQKQETYMIPWWTQSFLEYLQKKNHDNDTVKHSGSTQTTWH
ncbi:hypothetical protein BDN71DRAFT_1431405 [Pleurotus eryngii]|uniref:Uncharacterized protein n=1 Tax=Pleurotus eryngii TaxID=5323 RepID=A0A9P5ZWU0_PLEER|nr:hypothetical protein BDN71DRAFT_1431405 [Pleurotus eryngii]